MTGEEIKKMYFRGAHVYDLYPKQIKLELVDNCNRKCSFCGRADHTGKTMSDELFAHIVSQLNEKITTIDIGQSEPTLDPKLVERVRMLGKAAPWARMFIITNGDIIVRKHISYLLELYAGGVSDISVTLYDKKATEMFYAYVEANKNELYQNDIEVIDTYMEGCHCFSGSKTSEKRLIYVDESSAFNLKKKLYRAMNTQGSSVPFKEWETFIDTELFPLPKTCAEPLKSMVIRYDGRVKICCADMSRSMFVGDANIDSIYAIWHSEKMALVRKMLKNGRRDALPPCYACNRLSFRDGLYPLWDYCDKDTTYAAQYFASNLIGENPTRQYVENMVKLFDKHGSKNRFLASAIDHKKGEYDIH